MEGVSLSFYRTIKFIRYSIAGLWAARVCADHFEDVLIVEPETWLAEEVGRTPRYSYSTGEEKARSSEPEKRRSRVMQYRSTHCVLLYRLKFHDF